MHNSRDAPLTSLRSPPQPPAMVTDEQCAACDFNQPGKTCLKRMDWVWRGETYAATRAEYAAVKAQVESEVFRGEGGGQVTRAGVVGWSSAAQWLRGLR